MVFGDTARHAELEHDLNTAQSRHGMPGTQAGQDLYYDDDLRRSQGSNLQTVDWPHQSSMQDTDPFPSGRYGTYPYNVLLTTVCVYRFGLLFIQCMEPFMLDLLTFLSVFVQCKYHVCESEPYGRSGADGARAPDG